MKKIIVSACLLGCNCRYDGKNCFVEEVRNLSKDYTIIPICPEQMGGLTTPRYPSEIVNGKVINKEGIDVTKQYKDGAMMALDIAKLNHIDTAILKAKSPSCGYGQIYDGSFSGTLISGNGSTATLFQENGIKIYTENDVQDFLEKDIDNPIG